MLYLSERVDGQLVIHRFDALDFLGKFGGLVLAFFIFDAAFESDGAVFRSDLEIAAFDVGITGELQTDLINNAIVFGRRNSSTGRGRLAGVRRHKEGAAGEQENA